MGFLNFSYIGTFFKDKFNALNFDKNDLPDDYFDSFVNANEHCFLATQYGLTVLLCSNKYWNKDGNYMFMLCIPHTDEDGITRFYCMPFNWISKNQALYLYQETEIFENYQDAKKYLELFSNVNNGEDLTNVIANYHKNKSAGI